MEFYRPWTLKSGEFLQQAVAALSVLWLERQLWQLMDVAIAAVVTAMADVAVAAVMAA